jgi:hypothetical protein
MHPIRATPSCDLSPSMASCATNCRNRGTATSRRPHCCSSARTRPSARWSASRRSVGQTLKSRRSSRKGFGSETDSPIVGGTRVLKVDGTRGRANPYLAAIRARAAELGCSEPGSGYAVTEVVHCKSSNEKQGDVRGAMPTCVTRYASAVLQRSTARAFVFVGRIAAEGAKLTLGLECSPHLHGPALFAGSERMVAFLPHPADRESKKTFGGRLTDEELLRLRTFIMKSE